MKQEHNVNVRFGWVAALGLIFVVAKLWGVVDWSWWWVTAPFWIIPAALLVFFVVGLAVYIFGGALLDARRAKKRRKARALRARGRF